MPVTPDQIISSLTAFKANPVVKNVAAEINQEFTRIINYGDIKDHKESLTKESLITQLYQKLIKKLNAPEMKWPADFFDLLYQLIVYLVSLQPRNLVDVITQEKKEEIKPDLLFYTMDGYFWDITSLCQLMHYTHSIKNPATNLLLTPRDIAAIKDRAAECKIKIIPKDDKSGPIDPTPLDIMAIQSVLATAQRVITSDPSRGILRSFSFSAGNALRRSRTNAISFQDRYSLARYNGSNYVSFNARRVRPQAIGGRINPLGVSLSLQNTFFQEHSVEHYKRIIYRVLRDANLLNDPNQALIDQDTSFISELNKAVQNLSMDHLLTQENLQMVIACRKNANACAISLNILNKHNILDEANRAYLLENKSYLHCIAKGLDHLDGIGIVSQENFFTILQAPASATYFGILLVRLHKADILNQENRKLILDNLECVESLGLRIQAIHHLNQQEFSTLFETILRERSAGLLSNHFRR